MPLTPVSTVFAPYRRSPSWKKKQPELSNPVSTDAVFGVQVYHIVLVSASCSMLDHVGHWKKCSECLKLQASLLTLKSQHGATVAVATSCNIWIHWLHDDCDPIELGARNRRKKREGAPARASVESSDKSYRSGSVLKPSTVKFVWIIMNQPLPVN